MEKRFLSGHSIKEFKRKRKSNVQAYRFEEPCIVDDIKPYKRLITEDEYDTYTDSSNSTTPLYSNKYQDYETSTNGCLTSDESEYKDHYSNITPKPKIEVNGSKPFHIKSEKTDSHIQQFSNKLPKKEPISSYDEYSMSGEQATFRVDMSRFNCFNISASHGNSFLNSDFKSSLDSPSYKIPPSSTPPRLHNRRKNKNHIYTPHGHTKIAVSFVPCKGPACTSQICCAHFCSQKCYDNQKWPIGSIGTFKTSLPDYDSCGQTEINVTDYGLPYPDHTYCRDHKDIYFNADPNIDCPPYFELVESLFYEEKESRIKNPIPIPNCNGDPISSNGYVAHTAKRGRPKRPYVVGLLNPYIFHPSSEVIYTPFLFKDPIIEADRLSRQLKNQGPLVHAIRQCSNLYKDVRSDIPREVLYGSVSRGTLHNLQHTESHLQHRHHHQQQQQHQHHMGPGGTDLFDDDLVKNECSSDLPVIDYLFGSIVDDFPSSFK